MQNRVLAEDVRFLALQDERFKTARLTISLFVPLKEETAALYALMPELLSHATARLPDMIAVHRELSRLYGATVSSGVQRLGDHQVLSLGVSCIRNEFALQGEDVALSCAKLLTEMLFSPHLSADGMFDAADVQQEKRCLLENIASIINDKRAYARMRGDMLLADGEAYGIPVFGTVTTAQAITREAVTDAWKTLLKTAVIQCVYSGPDDGEAIAAHIQDAFADVERQPFAGETQTAYTVPAQPRTACEYMQVGQAKLTMGFRLPVHEPQGQLVATARLMSALYGSAPVSLLFRNVREKMSLCYYCGSVYDRVKGVMTVDSGVDAANVQRAKTEILHQLDMIRNGEFTDEELENSRRRLVDSIRNNENRQGSISAWYMGQALHPPFRTVSETVAMIEQVTKADIVQLAKEVSLVSVFVLLPEEDAV